MRFLVLTLAILGALAAFLLGAAALSEELSEGTRRDLVLAGSVLRDPAVPADAKAVIEASYVRRFALPYFLLAAGVLGVAGGVLAVLRRKAATMTLLLLAMVGPLALVGGIAVLPTVEARSGLAYVRIEPGQNRLLIVLGILAGVFVLGGLLALLIRPKPLPAQGPRPAYEEED